MVEVFDQNIGDLDPSGQNLDVSDNTQHNDTISIEVNGWNVVVETWI